MIALLFYYVDIVIAIAKLIIIRFLKLLYNNNDY